MMRRIEIAVALIAFVSAGCAGRRPWRLVKDNGRQVLIPPDVRNPNLAIRTLTAIPGKGRCPSAEGIIGIKSRGRRVRVTIARQGIEHVPAGWLSTWESTVEEQQCLAPGEASRISERIADSLPLDPSAATRLLYDMPRGEVALTPNIRLQLITPYPAQPGSGAMAEGPHSVTGNGYSLTVTGEATLNVVGYETAIYALQPKFQKPGLEIVPLRVERHIQGTTTQPFPGPTTDYFAFSPDAAFYRLFYKAGQTDYTALVVGARTPAELEDHIRLLRSASAAVSCEKLDTRMCVAIPKDVALNPLIAVTVNQVEVLVSRGANVFNAIRSSGEIEPNRVLPTLKILRPWNGRLVQVSFDRHDPAVLRLPLKGGEAISWASTPPVSR